MGRDNRDYGSSSAETQSLLGHESQPISAFVPLERRTVKDSAWTVSWVVLYLLTVGAGIFTFLNRNVDFANQVSIDYLNDPSHCPAHANPQRRSLFGMRAADDGGDPLRIDEFLAMGMYWLLGTVAGALLVGMLFVLMVHRSPKLLVGLAIFLQVGLPLLGGASAVLQGQTAGAVPLLMFAGMLALLFWLWRDQLVLVVQLLGVSGRGLSENLGLIGAVLGIQFGLYVLLTPLLVAMMSAPTNGHVVFNPARASTEQCVNQAGDAVLCCAWEVDDHAGLVMALAGVSLLWTALIGGEVRTFTVAGTIAQWYFTPVVDTAKRTRSSRVGSSLRAAMGPAFGSLCFGGLVLTLVSLLRSALEKLRQQAERNIFLYCLFILTRFLFELVELLTKFATVRIAITGEAFLEATRGTTDLLKRNFLDTFGVWWFPPLILKMSGLALSAVWSMGVYGFSAAAWKDLHQGSSYAVVLAVIAFLLTWTVLSFFISVLLNIIDTVFICFAMDRDSHTCTRLDVHEVYEKLPSVGPIVENPDGGYAYGAPPRQQVSA